MRPLWLEYPDQAATWALDESFLLGSDILVHPVVTKDAVQVSAFFPGKEPWYEVRTGAAHTGAAGKAITVSQSETPQILVVVKAHEYCYGALYSVCPISPSCDSDGSGPQS